MDLPSEPGEEGKKLRIVAGCTLQKEKRVQ